MHKTDKLGNFIVNWDYREIILLDRILTLKNIPHTFNRHIDGWQIRYPSSVNPVVSVIEHFGSYGHEKDLLEIMGLLTPEEEQCDSVKGFLTAENVYKRILNHYQTKLGESDGTNDTING